MSKIIKSKKYQTLLEKAHELFWKHGVRRVSVEEICREACVSKMTFYRFFPNKIELAKIIFSKVVEEGVVKFREIMTDENTSPVEKMEQMLLMKMESVNDISREFLADFYSNSELRLSSWVEEKTRLAWKEILHDFRKAQKRGWLRKDFNPEGILLMFNKLSDIINDEKIQQFYGTPRDMVMELARFFTFGIMPRNIKANNYVQLRGAAT